MTGESTNPLYNLPLEEEVLYWTVRYRDGDADEGAMTKEDAEEHLSNMRDDGHDAYLAEIRMPAWVALIANLESRLSSTAHGDARREVAAAMLAAGGPSTGKTALRRYLQENAPAWMTR